MIKTEEQIKFIKDAFEYSLASHLNLLRVSAPIYVESGKGINDDLSGNESPVSFINNGKQYEIVQSLAKWKRLKIKEIENDLAANDYEGIYTDMNAIRPNEIQDAIHSMYVDQWDWEAVIPEGKRNIDYLKRIVKCVVASIYCTQDMLTNEYPELLPVINSSDVHFITSQELLNKYPNLTPKEREYEITKLYNTVFIIGIGGKLSDGITHDSRAADYDDWELNGDLLIWDSQLNMPLEISSMGIRVSPESLKNQLTITNRYADKANLEYHSLCLNNELPSTIGGGIGQSRLCMLLLNKRHIGEVQVSSWNKETLDWASNNNVTLLK